MLETSKKALLAARLADDKKAEDITVLDVEGLCMFTDAFVLCTGGSSLQLRAITNSIQEGMVETGLGKPVVEGVSGTSSWVVLDYGDLVVHVMDKDARDYYQLESLWGDGRMLEWSSESVAAGA